MISEIKKGCIVEVCATGFIGKVDVIDYRLNRATLSFLTGQIHRIYDFEKLRFLAPSEETIRLTDDISELIKSRNKEFEKFLIKKHTKRIKSKKPKRELTLAEKIAKTMDPEEIKRLVAEAGFKTS